MSIDVIIPWGGDCPYRKMNLEWVADRWRRRAFNVIVGAQRGGPWSKAVAIADALRHSSADVLVITDGDVWVDDAVEWAYHLDDDDELDWVCPFRKVRRLGAAATSKVLAGGPFDGKLERSEYDAVQGGGITVIRRAVYDNVPLDPRFAGCGQEDDSWGIALRFLYQRHRQGHDTLWHLWHPPEDRSSVRPECREVRALRQRYILARKTKSEPVMRALLDEARSVLV